MNVTDTLMTSAMASVSHIPLGTLGTWFKVLVFGHLAACVVLIGAVFWGLAKEWRKQHGRR